MNERKQLLQSLFFWDAGIIIFALLIVAAVALGFSLAGRVPVG